MTLIQPRKSATILNRVIIALIGGIILSAIAFIFLYNQTVSFAHAALQANQTTQAVQAENASLKDKVFSLLDPSSVRVFAAEKGLIADPNPKYLSISKQWARASH